MCTIVFENPPEKWNFQSENPWSYIVIIMQLSNNLTLDETEHIGVDCHFILSKIDKKEAIMLILVNNLIY